MWVTWVLATLAGGLLFILIIGLGWSLATAFSPSVAGPQALWGSGFTIFLSLFIAAAFGAVPQALLIRRLSAPEQRSTRMIGWIMASALGGFLFIGYLLADITGPVIWGEVRSFYAPVTAIVALLTTSAQALALVRIVSPARLILYIPLTTTAWVIGWSLLLFNSNGTDIGSYLWYIVPFLCIAIVSGLVLAFPLRARRAVLQNGE
jgi:hypothetical protein